MSSGAATKALQQCACDAGKDLAQPSPDSPASAIAVLSGAAAPAPFDGNLPLFPEREYVDVARAARILGVIDTTVRAFARYRLIEMIDYAPRKWKRVRYQSIIGLCNRLRERYAIRDRRPPLDNPMFRRRDEDLLPFPLTDTIGIERAAEILGYASPTPVLLMIQEGRFDAYKFHKNAPWRISKSSLAAYLLQVRKGACSRPQRIGGVSCR